MDAEATSYLLEGRQLGSEVVAYFRLGVVRDPLPGHEMYLGRLTIPYITPAGVTSIRFKDITGKAKSKMMALLGDMGRIYNPAALLSAGPIYITEGEPDVWSCWMAGIPVVGLPGAGTWNPIFKRVFRNRDVTALCDGDEAGWKFGNEIYKSLEGCKIINFPKGCDPDKFRVDCGIPALRVKVGLDDAEEDEGSLQDPGGTNHS